jgi:CHAT domain-containing protein
VKGKIRGRNGDIYRDALRLLVELGRPQEAFHLLERYRAQAFLALLAERDLTFAVDLTPELDQERRRLAFSYDRNQLRLAELDPEEDGEAIGTLQREQIQLRRQREDIADRIRQTAPRLATLQHPQPLTFEQVREALDPGTVMLSYSVGKEQTHLFIVTAGRKLQVMTLEVGRQALEKDVDRFRQLIDQTQGGSGLGVEGLRWFSRRLYNLLVAPAEKWIATGDRIVLVPDGPLHLLPFAALIRKDGRHLVEWKPLSTVLSGTVFTELKRQRRDALDVDEPRKWVAFGDPWFPPRLTQSRAEDIAEARLRSFSTRAQLHWKRLPQSRREVEEVASLFPTDRRQAYLDREASEERAKAVGKDARIVHFATHGFVDDRSPFDSGLVLSIPEELAEGRDNGLLQVWEIFESVRLDADLVVLSACETGLGEIRGGEGIIGLTRAFQYAGARSVLASLWRVEDEATAELMQRFYRHLRAGKTKDEALREAQLELIRRPLRVPDGRGGWTERNAAAPYFWAALQLFGDSR